MNPHGERVEVREAADGGFFWRRFASNGEELSRSSETYTHEQHALDQAEELNPGVPVMVVVDGE